MFDLGIAYGNWRDLLILPCSSHRPCIIGLLSWFYLILTSFLDLIILVDPFCASFHLSDSSIICYSCFFHPCLLLLDCLTCSYFSMLHYFILWFFDLIIHLFTYLIWLITVAYLYDDWGIYSYCLITIDHPHS